MEMDDSTPVDEAIKQIDKLKLSFKDFVDTVSKDSDRLGGEYAMLVGEAKKMVTELSAVNTVTKQHQDLIAADAKATELLSKAAIANTDAQEANKKATEDATKATKDLDKAKDSLLKGQATELGSMDALKAKLDAATKSYYAMGEATDKSVKDDQLKKVEDLNKQYTAQKKVLDDAKKSTTEAAGSYNELNKKVIEAKKRLKEMEGGVDGTSKEFKKLQKEVKDGTKELKAWDEKIGDNQRKVGDYKNQIGELVPGFNNVAGSIQGAGKALYALAANPVGAVILAIAAAIGVLTAWFTRTETGGDKLQEMLGGLKGIFTVLLDVIAKWGGALFEALSKPEKLFKDLRAGASAFAASVVKVFQDPIPAIKAFGQFLWDQIYNRVVGLINVFKSFGGAVMNFVKGDFGAFKDSLKDLGNAAIQVGTGVENVIDKVGKLLEKAGINDLLKKAQQIGTQIAQLKDKLEDQEVALIKKRATTELDVNQKLLEAKDKLRYSDEQRFAAIKEVSKLSDSLLKQEIAAAQTKVAIAQKEIDLRKLTLKDAEIPIDLIKERNEAEAALIGLQSKRVQEQKALQKQEIAIIREIETEMLNKAKRELESENNLAKVRSEIRQRNLQQVASDTKLEVETRNNAVREITQEQINQAGIAAETALAASKEAALARIELDADTLATIYNNESLSVADRILLERQLKEEKLAGDEAYLNETAKIQEELVSKTEEMNVKMLETVKNNIFTQLQTDFNDLKNDLEAGSAGALQALNDEFAAGNLTIAQYEKQRKDIIANTNREILNDTIDMLEKKAALLKKDGQDTSQVENEIAQARLKVSQMTTDELLRYETALQAAKQELARVAYDSFISIVNSTFEAEAAKIQERLDNLQAQKEIELAAAGDNEARKAEIQNEFALKEEALQKKQQDQKRKQAIFNKTVAVFEIGVNTAKGIGNALGSFPPPASFVLAGIVGAIGALQIAAVLSKPIPQFAVGTKDAPGGMAIINELGPELIVTKEGKAHIVNTDGPTYAHVPKHATVYTAAETEKMFNGPLAGQLNSNMLADAQQLTVISEQRHDKELAKVFKNGFESLEYAIGRTKKGEIMTEEKMKRAFSEALEWKNYLDTNYR